MSEFTVEPTGTLAGCPTHRARGPYITTASGTRFYPLDPQPDDVLIEDIAHALARISRYNGHTDTHIGYSVGQHSIYVAMQLPPRLRLTGLLHDAPEYVIGDMVRPLKKVMPKFSEIEDAVWLAIAEKFGLPAEMPEEVVAADNAVLLAEKEAFLPNAEDWGIAGTPALIPHLHAWDALTTESAFLDAYFHAKAYADEEG